MCGISAIISNKYFDPSELIKMNTVIRHRGPDDEGFLLVDSKNNLSIKGGPDTPKNIFSSSIEYTPNNAVSFQNTNNPILGFGHRRLSILDLSSAGHMPMSYLNRRYWITYNGEIYNFLELREVLIKKGYKFLSNSDTEVILAAYDHWGSNCQNKFVGMWSFIIYDGLKKSIFLSRDRYGIKPLYYWISSNNNLHIASEIKQFTVLKGWDPKLNSARASDYLIHAYTDHTEETFFNNVFQIPGGHFIESKIADLNISSGNLHVEKWYNSPTKTFKGSFKEASIHFKELFKSSILLHLRSDVPVGAALSGGLDSSSIVCEISNLLKENNSLHKLKTFSSCSHNKKYDEKKWAEIVANHVDVEENYVYPQLERVFEITSDLIWIHDEPYQSQSAFLGYHVFELAKLNNIKVLLNGQGADEYLGGYGQFNMVHRKKLLKSLKLWTLIKDISKARENWNQQNDWELLKVIYNVIPFNRKQADRYQPILELINFDKLNYNYKHPNTSIPIKLNSKNSFTDYNLFYNPLNKYLKWEDRNSMAHSIEARVPFLDHRLVEFCQTLPVDFLSKAGENKRILREGLRDILPPKIRLRKDKKGFITPEEQWVRYDNPLLFKEKIKEAIEKTSPLFSDKVIPYFNKIVSGKIPFDYTYWRIILFSEWMDKFSVRLN